MMVGALVLTRDAWGARQRRARVCAVVVFSATFMAPFLTCLNTGPTWVLKMLCAGYLMGQAVSRDQGEAVSKRAEARAHGES